MSFAELKAFDAVAKLGGFVRAADALGRTQPTVTMQVQQLEKSYGVELVMRNRGRVVGLTPLGEQLHAITKHLFTLERDAIDLLRDVGSMAGGEVRLGAVAPGAAIRVANSFGRKFPAVGITLTFGNSERLLRQVVECEIEVGILGGHSNHPDCMAFPISKPEIVLVAHRDHPAAASGVISRETFAKETLLLREQGSETRDLVVERMKHFDYKPGRITEIGSRDGVVAAAAAGMGLAPVSAEEIDLAPSMRIVRFETFRVYGVIHAVCLASRSKAPLISHLIAAAKRAYVKSGTAAA